MLFAYDTLKVGQKIIVKEFETKAFLYGLIFFVCCTYILITVHLFWKIIMRIENQQKGNKMESKDIQIIFDTTGSMYPALGQVRNNVEQLVKRLFKEVSELRISIMAHGDYLDAKSTYVTKC